VHSNGTIYFTDPPLGLKNRTAELDISGIFRITPGGEVMLIEGWATNRHPNGIVLSTDERTLFVSEDNAAKVWQIALDPSGAPAGASTPFTSTSTTPDGMAVDCAGNLYVATDNGIEVYDRSGKTKLGTVPQAGSNCTFGGADRKTLYITKGDTLYWVRLNVPGLPD
jgi:gluconolactonase